MSVNLDPERGPSRFNLHPERGLSTIEKVAQEFGIPLEKAEEHVLAVEKRMDEMELTEALIVNPNEGRPDIYIQYAGPFYPDLSQDS